MEDSYCGAVIKRERERETLNIAPPLYSKHEHESKVFAHKNNNHTNNVESSGFQVCTKLEVE